MTDTLLILDGIGVPLYSARGLTQSLQAIQSTAHLERSVNGGLIDLSASQMRKYASKITCTDQQSPAIGGIWPGKEVSVYCVCELSYPTANPSMKDRTEVPGSIRTDGDFTFYRPLLTMVVIAPPNVSIDEYGHTVAWELDLEEA